MKVYDEKINYVGSLGVKGPKTIYGADINRCAFQHDRYYDNHKFSRKEADKRMLLCFQMKIKKADISKSKKRKANRVAKVFYGLVRLFGTIPYHKACRKLKRQEGKDRDAKREN